MYKRHNIWDEDKLDIHSSGYAGSSSGGSSSRGSYAGHGSGKDEQAYHKNELYGANKEDELKLADDYISRDQKEEDKKKEEEEREKTIVDAVEQEEKYQKEGEQEEFQTIAKGIQQSGFESENTDQNYKNLKKKGNKSIEEAIKEAIKEEKEIAHVD